MVQVEEAKAADATRLAEIVSLSPEAGRWPEEDLRLSIAAGERRLCLVARDKDAILGFLLTQRVASDEAEILTLAVDPAERRRGVATALLRALLSSRGGRIFLEVRRSNECAQRLYRREGFRVCGVRSGYYQSPAEDALLMELPSPE
jgi:ribosomal-protein-alanine N-acetyltransferase